MIATLALVFLACLILGSIVIWKHATLCWPHKLCTWLVIAYPFERIPSLTVGGGAGLTIRFSQIFTLLGLWVVAVLLVRRDKDLLQTKLNPIFWPLLLFTVAGIPSWYFVERPNRFLSTMIATLLAFGAAFLLSNFTTNVYQRIKDITFVMVFTSLFALYQVVGDLVGLPATLTLLDEQYTKQVLGIARAQGTALEPLYFAGMLFLPIITSLVFVQHSDTIKTYKNQFLNKLFANNSLLLALFTSAFLLTNSKSAIVTLLGLLIILVIFMATKTNFNRVWSRLSTLVILGVVGILGLFVYSPQARNVLNELWRLFIFTVQGRSSTAVDRGLFLRIATDLLPQFSFTGVGSGQYAHWARPLVWFAGKDQYLITNNVYVEVWLEHGFLAFTIFLFMLLSLLISGFIKAKQYSFDSNLRLKTITILSFALLGYVIQWLTFSPIFIMPIFIIIGLLSNELWSQ